MMYAQAGLYHDDFFQMMRSQQCIIIKGDSPALHYSIIDVIALTTF